MCVCVCVCACVCVCLTTSDDWSFHSYMKQKVMWNSWSREVDLDYFWFLFISDTSVAHFAIYIAQSPGAAEG